MTHAQLFHFEQDFVDTLRCVPMAVRYKLDTVGVKLSLRQWSRFTVADRTQLLRRSCGADAEIAAYRGLLIALIKRRAGEDPQPLTDPPCGSWRGEAPPEQVARYASEHALGPHLARAWANLSELQRYTLVKLSRENHDNVNFAPACREFGVV